MAQRRWVLPAPELPMAMRLAPVSIQSPVAGQCLDPGARHAVQGLEVEGDEGLVVRQA